LNFWWKPTTFMTTNQGLIKISTVDDKGKATAFLSVVYTAQNTLVINYNWNGVTNKSEIASVFNSDEFYRWSSVAVRIDTVSGLLKIDIFNDGTSRHIPRVIQMASSLKSLSASQHLINLGFEDTDLQLDENVNFEIYGITINYNTVISDSQIDQLRLTKPRKCRTPCQTACIDRVCPPGQRIKESEEIGDILKGTAIKSEITNKYLSNVPLFRPILDYKPSQTFAYYLISFDLDVQAYLQNSYTKNNKILFLLHNMKKIEYDDLSMNDLIDDSLIENGVISVVNKNDELYITRGRIPWANLVDTDSIPLGGKTIKDFSRIYISLLVDTLDTSLRVLVLADEEQFVVGLGARTTIAPLSYHTYVYNHPAIKSVKLNLHVPRFHLDLKENAQIHLNTVYTSRLCSSADENCARCHNEENSFTLYCLACRKDFKFFDSKCKMDYVAPPTSKDQDQGEDIGVDGSFSFTVS